MADDGNQGYAMEVSSPFMRCILECRTRMKKLRKKIYKNLKNKQSQQTPTKNKSKSFSVNQVLKAQRIPDFLSAETASLSRECGMRDITNFSLARKVDHLQLRGYADQQEREVQQILQKMGEQRFPQQTELLSEEEHETEQKVRSRSWLQSTEMEYDDSSLMDPHSKISLRPFELFGGEEEQQSKRSNSFDHLREANGFLSLDSEEYFEQNLFEF